MNISQEGKETTGADWLLWVHDSSPESADTHQSLTAGDFINLLTLCHLQTYLFLPLASTNLLTASNRKKLTHIAHRASKTIGLLTHNLSDFNKTAITYIAHIIPHDPRPTPPPPLLFFILLPWLQTQINCLEMGKVQQELGPLSSSSIAFTAVVAAAFQAILSFPVCQFYPTLLYFQVSMLKTQTIMDWSG